MLVRLSRGQHPADAARGTALCCRLATGRVAPHRLPSLRQAGHATYSMLRPPNKTPITISTTPMSRLRRSMASTPTTIKMMPTIQTTGVAPRARWQRAAARACWASYPPFWSWRFRWPITEMRRLLDVQADPEQDQRPEQDGKHCREHGGEAVQMHEVVVRVGDHHADDQVDDDEDVTDHAALLAKGPRSRD